MRVKEETQAGLVNFFLSFNCHCHSSLPLFLSSSFCSFVHSPFHPLTLTPPTSPFLDPYHASSSPSSPLVFLILPQLSSASFLSFSSLANDAFLSTPTPLLSSPSPLTFTRHSNGSPFQNLFHATTSTILLAQLLFNNRPLLRSPDHILLAYNDTYTLLSGVVAFLGMVFSRSI